MADEWGLPALIVALCAIVLTVSPVSLHFFASLVRPVVVLLWPRSGRCESLDWHQVPDGPLHKCCDPARTCSHVGDIASPKTFESMLTGFFAIKRGTYVRKPKQLRLDTQYYRTDTKTLKVFLALLNTREVFSAFNMSDEPFRLVFQPVGSLMTAYMTVKTSVPAPRFGHYRLDVSKLEMELILQGYPPWYQNPMQLGRGREVQHPILDESDLSRGGWIIAVGLSPTLPITRHFWTKADKLKIVDRALNRIVACFANIELAYPGNPAVAKAHTVAKLVQKSSKSGFGYSGSHLMMLYREHGFDALITSALRGSTELVEDLSDEQAVTAMNVFSFDEKLAQDQVAILEDRLEIVLQVCLLGVFKVLYHLYVVGSRHDRPCPIPVELEGDGYIYVRERWAAVED
jgi:hypothetical protein